MKLAHPDLHFVMEIAETRFPVLILEQSDLYFRLVSELCLQADGATGRFVLSEGLDLLDIGKHTVVVTDFFHLELNGKRQAAALMKRLNALAVSEHHLQDTLAVQDQIARWVMELEDELPYAVTHNDPPDTGVILKSAGIRFDDETDGLAEKICNLIRISAEYLNTRLLITVGLRTALEEDSVRELYKTAMYEKVPVLDIERYCPENRLDCEEYYIIDRDNCEIYNDPIV